MSGFPTDWEWMRRYAPERALHSSQLNAPQQTRSLGNLEPLRGLFALGSSAIRQGDRGSTWQQASRIAPLAQPALLRSQNLLRRGGFNPNQPRVPAGNPDGGQWTYAGGGFNARDLTEFSAARRPSRGGRFPEVAIDLIVRLAEANRRFKEAEKKILGVEQDWEPRTSSLTDPKSDEGKVLHAEARAREAEAKARQLGLQARNEPNRAKANTPRSRPVDGPAYIDAYRWLHNWPDLFGHETWRRDVGTVTFAEIDGSAVFGVNSNAPTYSKDDRADAMKMRATLIRKYPEMMNTQNLGRKPNDVVLHAEATILLRAAQRTGGTLAGRTIDVHSDRTLCSSCEKVLPKLALELGNPTVTFVNLRTGSRLTMRNGDWDRRGR